jgi:hypothetical protein
VKNLLPSHDIFRAGFGSGQGPSKNTPAVDWMMAKMMSSFSNISVENLGLYELKALFTSQFIGRN